MPYADNLPVDHAEATINTAHLDWLHFYKWLVQCFNVQENRHGSLPPQATTG
jgi:hypothetical protein